MDKYVVIRNAYGVVSYHHHTKEYYTDCIVLATTNCEHECISLCLIANSNMSVIDLKILDVEDYEELILLPILPWKSRLN